MERRLIDASELEADYRTQFDGVYKHIRDSVNPSDFFIERKAAYDKELARLEMEAFCEYLQSRPTISAVEVVRCRECKQFWEYSEEHKATVENADGDCAIRKWRSDDEQFCAVTKDDYCSLGKRREPDENAP